jgi:hypothetical protein
MSAISRVLTACQPPCPSGRSQVKPDQQHDDRRARPVDEQDGLRGTWSVSGKRSFRRLKRPIGGPNRLRGLTLHSDHAICHPSSEQPWRAQTWTARPSFPKVLLTERYVPTGDARRQTKQGDLCISPITMLAPNDRIPDQQRLDHGMSRFCFQPTMASDTSRPNSTV